MKTTFLLCALESRIRNMCFLVEFLLSLSISLELPNQLRSWFLDLVSILLHLKFQLQLALAENGAPISDYISTRPWLLLFIFLAIVVGLGLLQLAENGAPSAKSNANDVHQSLKPGEQEHPNTELEHYFEEGQEPGDRTATRRGGGAVRRSGACAFCGNPSTTRCSRCKAARYCSEACQIGHWRSRHKYECFETETAADQARPVHVHRASELVNTSERESASNLSHHGLEWNSDVGLDVSSRNDVSNFHSCEVCGKPSTTRCSRCKVVKYCSVKCLIVDWRWHKVHCIAKENLAQTERPPHGDVGMPKNSYEEGIVHSSSPLSLEFYPEGTTNFKHPIKGSQERIKEIQEPSAEWVRYLEEEVAKSRNEIILLQSERDKWSMRANIARERYHSLKKELFVLKNEKELISNAEKQARDVINSLSERLHHLQIVIQESIAEKRKQEEHIQTVQREWVQVKKELQEEQKRIQCLTVERDKSHETAQIAIREVEEIRQKLQEERERIQRLKENFPRDVTTAKSRATFAEACAICLTNEKDLAFGCGHMACRDCGLKLLKCPICREHITSYLRLFRG